jgi:hypothetical protein
VSQLERPEWMEPEPEQEVPPEFGRRLRELQEEAAALRGTEEPFVEGGGKPSPAQELEALKAWLVGDGFRQLIITNLCDVELGGGTLKSETARKHHRDMFIPHAHAIQADLEEYLK